MSITKDDIIEALKTSQLDLRAKNVRLSKALERSADNHAKLLAVLEKLADTVCDYPLNRASGSDVADVIEEARAAIEAVR